MIYAYKKALEKSRNENIFVTVIFRLSCAPIISMMHSLIVGNKATKAAIF